MAISEIEKLERRYQENPQGLTFAPLAEAYRKSGDPERALARLVPGLELHPDYIPASIVQGRCYLDMGNDAGAEASFAHVLSLDSENVIALKALADIAERAARFGDAERWLDQLLLVDRSNEDAQGQLERVRAAKEQAAQAEAGSAVPESLDAMPGDVLAVEGLEPEVPTVAEVPAPEEVLPPIPTVERATETARLEDEEPQLPPLAAEPFRIDSDAAVLDDAILGVTQLGGGDEIVLEAAPSTEYQLPSAVDDFGKGPALEAAGTGSEFQLPSASEELDLKPSGAVSEYQLPSASDDLALPDVSAIAPVSEYQLPDASHDLTTASLTGTEGNEFQAPDAASEFGTEKAETAERAEREETTERAERAETAVEAVGSVEAVEPVRGAETIEHVEEREPEEAPGQWTTWSDAALDPEAPPFVDPASAFEARATAFEENAPLAWTLPVEPQAAAPPESIAESIAEAAPEPEPEPEPEPVPEAEPELPPVVLVEETVEVVEVLETVEVVEAVEVVEEVVAQVVEVDAEPDLVVTESMAELFLAQGHAADALRVYRQLLERRPDDERLVQMVARLEVEAAEAEPTPHVAASMSGGTSVREMMRALLGTRPNGVERQAAPAAQGGPDAPGSPTRPAPDHLTLSAIFGDDASPLPPVMRPPPARPPADRGVTFDEFYGQPSSGATGGHERTTRLAQGEDDLDQFHDWLQNLKR